MRIGLVEFLLILAIASLTVGPQVALFVDRWMRRANRASAQAARRRAEYAAQAAAERDALRREYIDSVLGNLKSQLDHTYVVDEQGNKRKLKQKED